MLRDNSRIDALTGIRFFAAIAVVLYHFWGQMLPGVGSNIIVENGFMGVSLFFILSGYILAHVYLKHDESVNRSKFWCARFARIYPVYALSFVIAAPGIVHYVRQFGRERVAIASLFANLSMLQAWFPPSRWRWNTPAWSLSAEAFFYFLFPWIAALVVRRVNTLPRLLWTAAACIALSLVAPVIAAEHGVGIYDDLKTRTLAGMMVTFCPIFRLPQFIFGIVLCRIQKHWKPSRPSMLLAAGTIAFAIIIGFTHSIPYILRYNGVADLAFGAILMGLGNSGGLASRFLSRQPLLLLGEASYSIYILQVPFFWFFTLLIARKGPIAFACYLVTLIASSIACFRYFETPFRRFLVARMPNGIAAMRNYLLPHTVRCTYCGSTLSRSRAIRDGGLIFCSNECREELGLEIATW